MAWKTSDGKTEASHLIGQLETLIKGMLNKKTLLDLIRHFIVFEKSKKEDKETGIITIHTGDKKAGVVWHTQGSGKSLSMVFYTGKIVLALDNPTVLIITDRNDLDDQLFDTFASTKQLLRQDPIQADNRTSLKTLLKVASGGVVFTTIQKFQPEEGNIFEELSSRKNIIVIADEAHRTQYGFKAKTIDDKDLDGNVIGKKIVYGFAKYMRDALPNATYLGFTGTPIEKTDVNTPAVFGNYVDIYDISQAVEDGATVAIPHDKAMDVKDEVSFFQAIKARLAKFDSTGSGKSDEEIESTIRQVIDKALVTEKVIDIFDAAGIKKPDISILSEDFLLEVKNMEHKNIALELLKKLLNDEVKARTKKNLVQSKSLMEMLEKSIKNYHNKILTATEVIEELIELSKNIKNMDKEPQEMGLSDYEYAFYSAVADNDSARDLMQKDKLRELAVVLYQKVKENASIDWTIKESVKAKLKVIIKRTLRQFGYPPDMQMLATETVLNQAELLAEEMTRNKFYT